MDWLQVDVSLFPDETGSRPFVPWRALAEALGGWVPAGGVERFWFVRKLPGMRLRFAGSDLAENFEPALVGWLVAAERCNDIRGFRFGHYEPEQNRFGGAAGLAVAHDLFHDDSALVVGFESLDHDEQRRMDREAFALAITDDLFVRTLDDDAEVWDVWKRLEASLDASEPGQRAEDGDTDELRFLTAWRTQDRESPGSSLAEAAMSANQRTATALRSLAEAGRLSVGVRSWLAAGAAFQWNRWGLPLELPSLAKRVRSRVRVRKPDGPAGR